MFFSCFTGLKILHTCRQKSIPAGVDAERCVQRTPADERGKQEDTAEHYEYETYGSRNGAGEIQYSEQYRQYGADDAVSRANILFHDLNV